MQSVHVMWCFICKVCLLCSALYAKCPLFVMLYMQSVLIIQHFIYKVFLLCSALYAKCSYYSVLIYKVSLLCSASNAKCPCYVVLYMQSVLVMGCFICKVCLLFSALYGPTLECTFRTTASPTPGVWSRASGSQTCSSARVTPESGSELPSYLWLSARNTFRNYSGSTFCI